LKRNDLPFIEKEGVKKGRKIFCLLSWGRRKSTWESLTNAKEEGGVFLFLLKEGEGGEAISSRGGKEVKFFSRGKKKGGHFLEGGGGKVCR